LETVFILNDDPQWGGGFTTEFAAVRDTQTGLTKHESRRPYSERLRCSAMRYAVVADGSDRLKIEGGLRAMTTEQVVVPFWPALATWGERAGQAITGGLMLVWREDWSQFALYEAGHEPAPAGSPAFPADDDLVAPALMGFLTQESRGGFTLIDGDTVDWAVEFVEGSPAGYALSLSAAATTFAVGPQPAGYAAAPMLLPFTPDFTDVSEELRLTVGRQQVGFGREQQTTFYPHDAFRSQTAQYTLDGAAVPALLGWFLDAGGPGASFWVVGGFLQATLSANALAAATTLAVIDSSALRPGDYLCWTDAPAWAEVNTVPDGVSATLVTAFGTALASGAGLYGLHLAKLTEPKMSVNWLTPGMAQVKIAWSEVRPEENIPLDETIGVSLGKQAQRIVLFQFDRDFGNGTVAHWYYTAFEADVVWNGHTWLHAPMNCGPVSQSINMEEDSTQITSFIFDGNPLLDDLRLMAEAPLTVTIWFADYDGATVSNATGLFCGDCTEVSRNGSKITANANFGKGLFETNLPRFVRGVMCNHIGGSNSDGSFLISAGCALLKADWKFTGLVGAPISSGFPFTLYLTALTAVGASGAAATLLANWFANGWVEWGAGAAVQRRLIVGSTVPASGAMVLTLHRYFSTPPNAGDSITIYPGCDGLFATCQAYDVSNNPTGRFNNKLNFGGEPFSPSANPSIVGQPNLNVQGGKK
jgi:hypothetical protein